MAWNWQKQIEYVSGLTTVNRVTEWKSPTNVTQYDDNYEYFTASLNGVSSYYIGSSYRFAVRLNIANIKYNSATTFAENSPIVFNAFNVASGDTISIPIGSNNPDHKITLFRRDSIIYKIERSGDYLYIVTNDYLTKPSGIVNSFYSITNNTFGTWVSAYGSAYTQAFCTGRYFNQREASLMNLIESSTDYDPYTMWSNITKLQNSDNLNINTITSTTYLFTLNMNSSNKIYNSPYIKTNNYNFNIPNSAIVKGIQVKINKSALGQHDNFSNNDVVNNLNIRYDIINAGNYSYTDSHGNLYPQVVWFDIVCNAALISYSNSIHFYGCGNVLSTPTHSINYTKKINETTIRVYSTAGYSVGTGTLNPFKISTSSYCTIYSNLTSEKELFYSGITHYTADNMATISDGVNKYANYSKPFIKEEIQYYNGKYYYTKPKGTWSTTKETYIYGGENDLWDSNLKYSNINTTGFGFIFGATQNIFRGYEYIPKFNLIAQKRNYYKWRYINHGYDIGNDYYMSYFGSQTSKIYDIQIRVFYDLVYSSYTLSYRPDIFTTGNTLKTNDTYFKYQKCFNGICYSYVINIDDIYDKSIMTSNGKYINNMYNEYNIIDEYMSNVYQVDIALNENIDLTKSYHIIDNIPIKPNHLILLMNQTSSKTNDVYKVNNNYFLENANLLSTRESSYRSSFFVKLGTNTQKQYFLKNVGNIFPISGETKNFIDAHSYIIKHQLDYNIFNDNTITFYNDSGYTISNPSKILFTDYAVARTLAPTTWEGFDLPFPSASGFSQFETTIRINYLDNLYKLTSNYDRVYYSLSGTSATTQRTMFNVSGNTSFKNDNYFSGKTNIGDHVLISLEPNTSTTLIQKTYYADFRCETDPTQFSIYDSNLNTDNILPYVYVYGYGIMSIYNKTKSGNVITMLSHEDPSGFGEDISTNVTLYFQTEIELISEKSVFNLYTTVKDNTKDFLTIHGEIPGWIYNSLPLYNFKITNLHYCSATTSDFERFLKVSPYGDIFTFTDINTAIMVEQKVSDYYKYFDYSLVTMKPSKVYIKCVGGKNTNYIATDTYWGSWLFSSRPINIDDPQIKYEIIYLDNGLINIKSYNGKYVCVDENVGNLVIADRITASIWETFKLTKLSNGYYTIQNRNDLYFSNTFSDTKIICNAISATTSEYFILESVDEIHTGKPYEKTLTSDNHYYNYKLKPFIDRLGLSTEVIYNESFLSANTYTVTEVDINYNFKKQSSMYKITPSDNDVLFNFKANTYIDFGSLKTTLGEVDSPYSFIDDEFSRTLIYEVNEDYMLVEKPRIEIGLGLTSCTYDIMNVSKLDDISEILNDVYLNYTHSYYYKQPDNIRTRICAAYAEILKNNEFVSNLATGIIYQKDDLFNLDIFDVNVDENYNHLNDSNLTYKPIEIIDVGLDRKTKLPIPLELNNISLDEETITWFTGYTHS